MCVSVIPYMDRISSLHRIVSRRRYTIPFPIVDRSMNGQRNSSPSMVSQKYCHWRIPLTHFPLPLYTHFCSPGLPFFAPPHLILVTCLFHLNLLPKRFFLTFENSLLGWKRSFKCVHFISMFIRSIDNVNIFIEHSV